MGELSNKAEYIRRVAWIKLRIFLPKIVCKNVRYMYLVNFLISRLLNYDKSPDHAESGKRIPVR
jgi:hypothetical protein